MNYKQKAELREMMLEVAKKAPELIGREEWMKRTGKTVHSWYWNIKNDTAGIFCKAPGRAERLCNWTKYINQWVNH